jgi:hypothetical protein
MVLIGEHETLGENPVSLCHFVHRKSNKKWPAIETSPPRGEVDYYCLGYGAGQVTSFGVRWENNIVLLLGK